LVNEISLYYDERSKTIKKNPYIHILRCLNSYTIVSEEVGSYEMSEQIYQTTRHHILEDVYI